MAVGIVADEPRSLASPVVVAAAVVGGVGERRGGAAGTGAAAVGEDGGEHLVRYEGSQEKGSG